MPKPKTARKVVQLNHAGDFDSPFSEYSRLLKEGWEPRLITTRKEITEHIRYEIVMEKEDE